MPLTTQQAAFEAAWLPAKPLCAPAKNSPYRRRSRTAAAQLPFIEANPLVKQSLIIADIDSGDVAALPKIVGLPPASWAVRTRNAVGTGHIGYALATPVALTDAARRRPVNLLARVELGIREVLGGDPGYTGRIMKNPLAPGEYQDTLWIAEDEDDLFPTYGLKDLATALDRIGALPAWDSPRPRQASGIGRNVDVFDRTRKWAYRAIKRYWEDGQTVWGEVVEAKAMILNAALEVEGREPLPEREIYHLARSITSWTWRKFSPQGFADIQVARGKKLAEKRIMLRQSSLMEALNGEA